MSPAVNRVVVTGMSYLSGLGFGSADHEPALREGRSTVGPISRFDTTGFRTANGAQVDRERLDRELGACWSEEQLSNNHTHGFY